MACASPFLSVETEENCWKPRRSLFQPDTRLINKITGPRLFSKSGAKVLLLFKTIVRIFRTSVFDGLKRHEFALQRDKIDSQPPHMLP